MNDDALLATIRSILAQPTAPFHEDAVRGEIVQLLAQCPHVTTSLDGFGNVIAHYQRGDAPARFAFAVHMDHPGFVQRPAPSSPSPSPSSLATRAEGGEGEGDDEWEFLGGVPESYREKKPPVRDFGAFAMWDLPACEVREGRVFCRACDDLIGCAAVVTTFQELERSGAEANCYGVFTRAEEVGFIGAIELAKSARLPRDVTVLSLECSSEKGGMCRMGDGAILRVGDRTSIFDPHVTATIAELAKNAEIPVQRCLMSGGTCEATAYQLYGYRCGALCVALGNYHNCGPDERIEPEFVALDDVRALTRLCIEIAKCTEPPEAAAHALRERLEKRAAEYRERFA